MQLLHTNLMNSPGHKANILNGTYREIGIGFQTGAYQTWDGAFVQISPCPAQGFLTGVTMDDKDGDHFYDVGEGLGGLTITAVWHWRARAPVPPPRAPAATASRWIPAPIRSPSRAAAIPP